MYQAFVKRWLYKYKSSKALPSWSLCSSGTCLKKNNLHIPLFVILLALLQISGWVCGERNWRGRWDTYWNLPWMLLVSPLLNISEIYKTKIWPKGSSFCLQGSVSPWKSFFKPPEATSKNHRLSGRKKLSRILLA